MKTSVCIDRAGRRQTGLSLIELMIALALGLVLILVALYLYVASKQSYRGVEALSRLQESGRAAVRYLENDLRLAGHLGCLKGAPVNHAVSAVGDANRYVGPLKGYEGSALPPGLVAGAIRADSDSIHIQGGSFETGKLVATMVSKSDALAVDDRGLNFGTSELLMVADCANADIIEASVSGTAPALTITYGMNPLSKAYDQKAEVMRFVNRVYFISAVVDGECTAMSLCRKTLRGKDLVTELVIQNVEGMKLLYGQMDASGSVTRYTSAAAVTDWSKVASVQLSLLLRSDEDNVATSPQPYEFNGASTTPNDRRLRKVFVTTVGLRNVLD